MAGYPMVTLYLDDDDPTPTYTVMPSGKAASIHVYLSGTTIHSSDPAALRRLGETLIDAATELEHARAVTT